MKTPLFLDSGYYETVKTLIDCGAEVNAKDDDGNTSLHYAVALGKLNFFQSTNLNIELNQSLFKLFPHFCLGRDKTVKILIENGAEINCKDKNGLTPLHNAANRGISHICSTEISNHES